jgi:hypothetical protein
MIEHCNQLDVIIRQLIRRGKICLGGNKQFRIYGTLNSNRESF